MEKLKKLLDRIFIDGLTGMAQGLFCNIDRRHNYSADWKFDWRECWGYDFCTWKDGSCVYGGRNWCRCCLSI